MKRARALALGLVFAAAGCRDLSSFSTKGASYEGEVVQGDFVRAGVEPHTRLCLTLDTDHLQDTPGAVWTSDGLFHGVALRPIPQIWHDPLSTLSFGEGRVKNLVYVAAADAAFEGGKGDDVFVIVSLMESGEVEARLLRGAPGGAGDAGVTAGGNLFAVFALTRKAGPCSF
jgi:hypothetical protein